MKEKILRLGYGVNKSYLFWIFFVFIIAIQFVLFRKYVIREVISFYPVAFDQTSYLFNLYDDYEPWFFTIFIRIVILVKTSFKQLNDYQFDREIYRVWVCV